MASTLSRARGALTRARNSFRGATLLYGTLSIMGCDREPPTALQRAPQARPDVIEIASPAQSAYDDGINPYDTYVEQTQTVAETTTVTSTQPFDDPNTGQRVYSSTVGSSPQTVNVSAGYGYDGQPRVTNGFQQSGDEETIWLRRITDATTDRRADGSDTQPFLYDPMDQVGSLFGARLAPGAGGGAGGGEEIGGGGCTQITGCDGTFLRSAGVMTYRVVRAADADPSSPSTRRRITRDYQKRDGEWLLTHTMHETFVETPQLKTRHALHLTVITSKFHRNAQKDAERARSLPTSPHAGQDGPGRTPPPPAPPSPPAPPPASLSIVTQSGRANDSCDPATAIIPCSTDPTGGDVELAPVDQTVVVPGDYARVLGGSGPVLVLQHGFHSDARTWRRMEGWLARDVTASAIYRFSLPWQWTYENQAAVLQRRIAGTVGNSSVVLIGHSNGGMIARYLARHPRASGDASVAPANVNAVITIGTPHLGTPLAKYGTSVVRLFGWGGMIGNLLCTWQIAGCNSFGAIHLSTLSNIYTALTPGMPVLSEMQPTDAYHAAFNAEPETFKRFAVTSSAWSRWMPWRGFGDAFCFPDASCGGAAQVRRIDRIYKRDIACVIIGSLFGRWNAVGACASDASFLRAVDAFYRGYTQTGDGAVPLWSQQYPSVPDLDHYPVQNGPFHWGETQSSRVGNRIETILTRRLGTGGQVALKP